MPYKSHDKPRKQLIGAVVIGVILISLGMFIYLSRINQSNPSAQISEKPSPDTAIENVAAYIQALK